MLRHSSTLLAALTLLLVPARSRAAQPGEIRTGSLPRDAETLLLMENAGNAGKLRPEVFRRLSSAGQRAVLRAAGLLPPPAARAVRAPLAGGVRRPLTPSPGQNVHMNDPTALATVNGLQQNDGQRSNLAIVNRGDASDTIALRVTYYGADGAALLNPDTAMLAPGEWRQFNGPLASRGATVGFAKIERLSGSSRWAAYGILNDQHNSDGSYIPMSR